MDVVDSGNEVSEILLAEALSVRKKEPSKQGTGKCWFCEAELENGRRWCDAYCRDSWEAEQ